MELVLSSISLLHLGAVDAYGTHRLPSQRTRIKQIKLVLPRLGIFSKSNELKVKNKRRSANYHPSIWDPRLIESLNSPYTNKLYAVRLEELKGDAKKLFKSTRDPFEKLKLVDTIQKLGLAYHFEEEIKDALNLIASSNFTNNDLYTTALKFRLLRQHGYPISSGEFDKFRSQDGRFMDSLNRDAAGLLSLYEASYLGMNGEDDLEEAKKFSSRHLKSLMGKMEGSLAEQVKHSLDIPLHWRMPRLEAWNFVSNVYQNVDTKSTTLLELAKLDYNIVQSVHHKEVNELSRWWRDLGFKENLSFARDRLMENYLWAMGIVSEPQFFECRIGLTKFICILTVIDDIYDVYGSLDELETFTDTVNRWDVKAMEDLPKYLKICYLAMFNYANEITYAMLKDHGLNIQPQIMEAWTNLCRSYLVEARWFNTNYTPTVNEYLENGWISVGGPSAMVHAYILQGGNIKEHVDCFKYGSKLFYWSSLITRLSNDLGTSKDEIMRGDVMKAIQCYMREEDISEEQARVRIKDQINFSWKKLNEESAKNFLPKSLVSMSLNMARTAQCLFQYGDGIGTSTGVTKDLLTSLIIEPIPIEEQMDMGRKMVIEKDPNNSSSQEYEDLTLGRKGRGTRLVIHSSSYCFQSNKIKSNVEEVPEGENVEEVREGENVENNKEEVEEGENVEKKGEDDVDVEVGHDSGSTNSSSSSDDDLNVHKCFVTPSSGEGIEMKDDEVGWESEDSNGEYELFKEDFETNVPPVDKIPHIDEFPHRKNFKNWAGCGVDLT